MPIFYLKQKMRVDKKRVRFSLFAQFRYMFFPKKMVFWEGRSYEGKNLFSLWCEHEKKRKEFLWHAALEM